MKKTIPKNPLPGIYLTLKYIDPDAAVKLLASSPEHQRSISRANLVKIEHSLMMDKFVVNGQPIIVDANGKLMDGQHRLQAVVNTGIGIWTVFVGNIPEEYFRYMDCGKSRSFSDVLKTTGKVSCRDLAATTTRMAEYLKDPARIGASGQNFAHSELIAVGEMCPGLPDALRAVQICTDLFSPSQVAWLHYIIHEEDPESADRFFRDLAYGADLPATSPVVVLRRQILTYRGQGFHMLLRDTLAMLVRTWNLWFEGKTAREIPALIDGEPFPTVLLPKKKSQAA